MKLVDDWGRVLKQAWSVKFTILTFAAAVLEVALPFFTTMVPPGVMAGLAALSAVLSTLTRVLQQQGMHDDPQK